LALQLVYVIVAVTAYFYPNAELTTTNGASGRGESGGGETTEALIAVAKMLVK
jgi:hypothetical protein